MEDEERLCISSGSDWMSEMPSGFWDIPLWNLSIPGTSATSDYSVLQLIDDLFLLLLFNNFDICLHFSGSHDTMTYCLDERSSVLKSSPRVVQVLDTFFPCIVRPCIIKWATTQVWQTVMMRYYVVLKLYEFIYLFGTQKATSATNSLSHFHYIV